MPMERKRMNRISSSMPEVDCTFELICCKRIMALQTPPPEQMHAIVYSLSICISHLDSLQTCFLDLGKGKYPLASLTMFGFFSADVRRINVLHLAASVTATLYHVHLYTCFLYTCCFFV